MVMSQGTYTFLTCFAGFWLIWGLIVLLCCFCSFLRRRLKRPQDGRLRDQPLRALELEPLDLDGSPSRSPPGPGPAPAPPPAPAPLRIRLEPPSHPQHRPHPAHPAAHPAHPSPHGPVPPPRPWSYPRQDSDLSKPPCYEEAMLMAEPPPPYSEVLTDTRGLYRKIAAPFLSRDGSEKQDQPPSSKPLFLERAYSSALHLPSGPRPGPPCPALYLPPDRPRRLFPSWTDSELSGRDPLDPGAWRLPVSVPLLGRTTAV
ncbi:proline-rich protein 7 isoform X2 [Tachyglossus aculeatus]|uniref:proline-rich protein 7 isoform X2 n=1 Tax=Tachyglossus aculeatus TaxID=9261 RepID=UPI0018F44FE8|nr:proline-rich protein 7 isoform X2 [Tachyglossus aculeatus]